MDGTGKNVKVKRKTYKLGKKEKLRRKWRWLFINGERQPAPGKFITRNDGCRDEKKPVLFAGKTFCNASRDRHLELLVLVRLHHEQDPENE